MVLITVTSAKRCCDGTQYFPSKQDCVGMHPCTTLGHGKWGAIQVILVVYEIWDVGRAWQNVLVQWATTH